MKSLLPSKMSCVARGAEIHLCQPLILFVLNSTGFQEGRKDDKIESRTQTALEGIFDIHL